MTKTPARTAFLAAALAILGGTGCGREAPRAAPPPPEPVVPVTPPELSANISLTTTCYQPLRLPDITAPGQPVVFQNDEIKTGALRPLKSGAGNYCMVENRPAFSLKSLPVNLVCSGDVSFSGQTLAGININGFSISFINAATGGQRRINQTPATYCIAYPTPRQ